MCLICHENNLTITLIISLESCNSLQKKTSILKLGFIFLLQNIVGPFDFGVRYKLNMFVRFTQLFLSYQYW